MRIFSFIAVAFFAHAALNAQTHVSFTSSNLPIIVINTHGQPISNEPKIIADMGIIDKGPGQRNNLTDPFNDYNGKIGIEVRGSSSQMFPKKQYGVELRDENGAGVNASLLGLPEEEDWILFAPYNDKTLMRDALAYRLARATGNYASRVKFCELVLNDQYQGIYVLLERVKRDKKRVDINKLDPDENSGDNLTGGYIIKIDKTSGNSGQGWSSTFKPVPSPNGQRITFQYEVPKYDAITTEQKQYIQDYVQQFETALSGPDFQDADKGYAKFINVNSFVDYYLLNELSKNVDGYRLSTFFHKHRDSDGGKISMGPAWDYNLGFGNADYCTKGDPEGFVLAFNNLCSQDSWLIPFWWNRLLGDQSFSNKIANRWAELREGPFSVSSIHGYIDSVRTVLNESSQRNFQAWPVLGKYVWPNYYVGASFPDEVTWLKNWVSSRLNWLDKNFPQVISGIENKTIELPTVVYPNPFTDEVQFQFRVENTEPIKLTVWDVMGRPVHEDIVTVSSPGVHTYTWNTLVPPQLLIYKIQQGEGRSAKGKLVKR